MSVPGSNLLIRALRMLAKHEVTYIQYSGRTLMENGIYASAYLDGVVIKTGHVQPVPRMRYLELGYDANRNYVTWYVPALNVKEVRRGTSGDQFQYKGALYQTVDNNDWFNQDGWIGIVGVEVPAIVES